MLESIVFQHDTKFILNQIVRSLFHDTWTHCTIITEPYTKLTSDLKILNAEPTGVVIDTMKVIAPAYCTFEVWSPVGISSNTVKDAVDKSILNLKGKQYGYFQIMGYLWFLFARNFNKNAVNPLIDGVWCSEVVDVFLGYCGIDAVKDRGKDEVRPQELYNYVSTCGLFEKTYVKLLGESLAS